MEDISDFITDLARVSDAVKETYEIFRTFYKDASRAILLTDIINGESIVVNPNNITIDDDLGLDPHMDMEQFELRTGPGGCVRTMYPYQKKAIKQLRALECSDGIVNPRTGRTIKSNGWQLSLPIGSGKSLVFLFLALYYRDVPAKPIYVSMDGSHIPFEEAVELKHYPYYYERCAYVEGEESAVVAYSDYPQRKCTVILTHNHLMDQLYYYIQTDFPVALSKPEHTVIEYVDHMKDRRVSTELFGANNVVNFDLLIVHATEENVMELAKYSWMAPFMRVIIDDYTGMGSIGSFKQILASSTIYVSGSGYSRDPASIPVSYYTLKYTPTTEMTLVGDPRDTYCGVRRDNIATVELLGSSSECNIYSFVATCEDMCASNYSAIPSVVYPVIQTEPKLFNYLALKYVMDNIARFRLILGKVEVDSQRKFAAGPRKGEIMFDMDRAPHYKEWKRMMSTTTKIGGVDVSSPLLIDLFRSVTTSHDMRHRTVGVVTQNCHVCKNTPVIHGDYGLISRCCGTFYCYNCLKHMTTQTIYDSSTDHRIHSSVDYYCVCCRSKNPRFMYNLSRQSGTKQRVTSLAKTYLDVSDLAESTEFDYTFYMLLNGFKPLYHEGKALNITVDISLGKISPTWYTSGAPPEMENILSVDQLAMTSLYAINLTLTAHKITPIPGTTIIIYRCPSYMQTRVNTYFKSLVDSNPLMKNIELRYHSTVDTLIGMQANVLGIVVWESIREGDSTNQLVGRMLRLQSYKNPLNFYITTNATAYE